MPASKDVTGQRFYNLVAIDKVKGSRPVRWNFICDCGAKKEIRLFHVTDGKIKSCGCIRLSQDGWSQSPIFKLWRRIHKRCNDESYSNYHRYGGRGISVCEEWSDFYTFKNWAQKNGFSENLEIDRKNNNSNYSPDNCRFVTRKENVRNREITIFVEYNGGKISLAEACEISGVTYSAAAQRIKSGDSNGEIFRCTSKTLFFGEPMTYIEAEKKFGIKERTIRSRIKKGLTPEQSVTIPTKMGKKLPI